MIEDKNIINKIEQWLNYEYTWVLYVFLIVLLTLSVAFFARVFLNKLAEKAQKTKNPWDDAIIIALHLPCRL
ncbi:MAG: MscS family membrane protein, partial [Cellvibrionaceae bacterium]